MANLHRYHVYCLSCLRFLFFHSTIRAQCFNNSTYFWQVVRYSKVPPLIVGFFIVLLSLFYCFHYCFHKKQALSFLKSSFLKTRLQCSLFLPDFLRKTPPLVITVCGYRVSAYLYCTWTLCALHLCGLVISEKNRGNSF